jgi:hypothetical protein
MSRRLSTDGQLVLVAAALALTAYVLVASVQTAGNPAVRPGQLADDVLLGFAAFMVLLALVEAARFGVPPLLARWRLRRARRRRVRHRARRIGGRW